MISRRVLATVVALGSAIGSPAIAGPPGDHIEPSYFFDAGALLFFWTPIAGTVAVDTYVAPRSSPLLFSASEGGAESRQDQEIPGYVLTIGGATTVVAIALGDDPSRYYHAKGLAQSLATSVFLDVTAKPLFGRHRPDFDPAMPTDDGRRSFPSGHSTRAMSTIAYAALYLHYHGFDQWREPGTTPWWEVATYVGLGSLGVGLMGERVYHHRHHVTDVVAGGALGTASSIAFFYYQERRFKHAKRRPAEPPLLVEPKATRDALMQRPTLPDVGGPMLSFGSTF